MLNLFKKPVIGLDISDNSIEAVQLGKSGGKIKIVAYARTKLSSGIIDNGKIKHVEQLITEIKRLIASAAGQKFNTKNVVLSLPESRLYVHIFSVAKGLKGDKLDQEIEKEAANLIPTPLDDLYWDQRIVSHDKNQQKVLFVAAPVDLVDQLVEAVSQAGLKPVAIDYESASLAASLIPETPEKEGKGAVMLLDIGARTTGLSIYDNGAIQSTFNIKIAGNKITQELVKQAGLTEPQASKIKSTSGLDEKKSKHVSII